MPATPNASSPNNNTTTSPQMASFAADTRQRNGEVSALASANFMARDQEGTTFALPTIPSMIGHQASPRGRTIGSQRSDDHSSLSVEDEAATPSCFSYTTTVKITAPEHPQRMSTVNDIQLGEELGRGAYGVVYRGACSRYPQQLAVKAISRQRLSALETSHVQVAATGELATVTLPQEVRVMAQVPRHQNVVPVFEVIDDPTNAFLYIIMPYIRGQASGTTKAMRRGKVPIFVVNRLTEAAQNVVARDVASALNHLHDNGIVHGDLKPENVLLTMSTSGLRALLVDFGMSHSLPRLRILEESGFLTRPMTPQAHALDTSAVLNASTCSRSNGTPGHNNTRPLGDCHQQRQPTASHHPLQISLLDIDTDADPLDAAVDSPSAALARTPQQQQRPPKPCAPKATKPPPPRGTPAFLAPELFADPKAPTTAMTDAWALGILLYGQRYGRLPFAGSSFEELQDAVLRFAPQFPSNPSLDRVERRWQTLLGALLQKDPNARMSPRELLASRALVSSGGSSDGAPSPQHPGAQRC